MTRNVVPDGMKKYLDNNVKVPGNGGTVVYYLPRSGTTCIERFVDLEKQTCTCGLWKMNRFPCHHAVAQFVEKNCHESYHINEIVLSNIANALIPFLAPTGEELDLPSNMPGFEKEAVDPDMTLQPPSKRGNDKHGNSKRKRKTSSSKASKSLGNTHTASYAQASRSTVAKKAATGVLQMCSGGACSGRLQAT